MRSHIRRMILIAAIVVFYFASAPMGSIVAEESEVERVVDATSLDRKVMCGYQGWFRCPSDAANEGWVHWSRDSRRITPQSLTFEMWPDLTEFPKEERFAVPGFTDPDGTPAELFSSDNAATVQRHFEWMRDYGIDVAWLQHFVVDLPGGPIESRYPSRRRVLEHVRAAAKKTGRAWALAYDISGTPADVLVDVIVRDWKRMVDEGVTSEDRYLHHDGKPVIQIWGFYRNSKAHALTPESANRLLDLFDGESPYSACVVGGGDWDWRRHSEADWQAVYSRFDAYMPWNVGNYAVDEHGIKRASTASWRDDIEECRKRGVAWIPVVYPGFSWDNLQRQPPGSTTIPRRKGAFLWEQFHELANLGVDSVYVAMFDEVDEGTAIFKVSNTPPTQAHFVDLEGLPTDTYLRLTNEGGRMLRQERPITTEPPLP